MSRREKSIKLSESDYDRLLQESEYHDKPDYKEECWALLLNHAGVSIKQIGGHLKGHPLTAFNWLKGWEKEQFTSLARKKGQGCKGILVITDATHIELLGQAVGRHRQDVKSTRAELVNSLDRPMWTCYI